MIEITQTGEEPEKIDKRQIDNGPLTTLCMTVVAVICWIAIVLVVDERGKLRGNRIWASRHKAPD